MGHVAKIFLPEILHALELRNLLGLVLLPRHNLLAHISDDVFRKIDDFDGLGFGILERGNRLIDQFDLSVNEYFQQILKDQERSKKGTKEHQRHGDPVLLQKGS